MLHRTLEKEFCPYTFYQSSNIIHATYQARDISGDFPYSGFARVKPHIESNLPQTAAFVCRQASVWWRHNAMTWY